MVGVGIDICGSDIYQLIIAVNNIIDWCVHIKSQLFDHILTLGKHPRFDFTIRVEDIIEDDISGLLDGVSVAITQGSDALRVGICDNFLS